LERSDFLIRKILFAVATILVTIVFNFFLFRILPGDPVKLMVHNSRMTREAQERMRITFGLDKPVWLNIDEIKTGNFWGVFDTQFFAYLRELSRGDLGVSFTSRMDVADVLRERVWRTVLLVLGGELVAILFGSLIGMIGAWKRGSRVDAFILIGALFTWGIPTFFLGIILLILSRGLFPAGGMVTPGLKPEDGWTYWSDVGHHLVLPTLTIAILYTGQFVLIMRSGVMDTLTQDYILAAKAKGLKTIQILRDHALKNAMLPLVTVIALTLGYTVAGAIQVETVFSWPGLGRLMFDAVNKQDFPLLQGAFLLLAVSVILANLLADLLYMVLDPRVKAD
jgi:peptide/nickel transport system permease protein